MTSTLYLAEQFTSAFIHIEFKSGQFVFGSMRDDIHLCIVLEEGLY